jgi:hypothetical protein
MRVVVRRDEMDFFKRDLGLTENAYLLRNFGFNGKNGDGEDRILKAGQDCSNVSRRVVEAKVDVRPKGRVVHEPVELLADERYGRQQGTVWKEAQDVDDHLFG